MAGADLKRALVLHAHDYPVVRACLEARGLRGFCYLQAAVGRSDLLVEIEAEAQSGPLESL